MGFQILKNKIESVRSTQKLTDAMRMVATAKMRSAQEKMKLSRPYAEKILEVISHLAKAHQEYRHPYLIERPKERNVGYIIITTDRGLCGSLNSTLLKKISTKIIDSIDKGIGVSLYLVGAKADVFFRSIEGCQITARVCNYGKETRIVGLLGGIRVMLDSYMEEKIDSLSICYNRFVNTMTQRPIIQKLIPLVPEEGRRPYWDYIYEPDSSQLLEPLLERYIESQVYQGLLENHASEQSARMVAMMGASENASRLIDSLTIEYNKARQSQITQEIAEIISGSEAISS